MIGSESAAPRRARVGELELAYETFGAAGDPALLLIMGLASQMMARADEFCESLAEAGYHVIRFDNRDIGLSTQLDRRSCARPGETFARRPI